IQIIENALFDLTLSTEDFTTMLVHCEKLAKDLENQKSVTNFPKNELFEVADFIHWLTDGGFVFLGYSERDLNVKNRDFGETVAQFGILKTSNAYLPRMLEEVKNDCLYALDTNSLIFFSKLHVESSLHRHTRINHITITLPSETTG